MKTTYQLIKEKVKALEEENEKLKNGYCELKVKCNNGECDCTNEEYDEMVQANMKLSLELDQANSTSSMYAKRCIKAIEYIEQLPFDDLVPLEVKVIYQILKGE